MKSISVKAIESTLSKYGYSSHVKEIRKGRRYKRVITDTDTIFLIDEEGWLREYPSKRMIKKVQ